MKPHHRFALALTGALLLSSLPAGAASLTERYEALRAEQPKLALRDAFAKLNVSEAELLAANGIGKTVTRLQEGENVPREIMRRALDLGKVMAMTRNENAILERTGVATRMKPQEPITGLDADKEKEREARMRNIAGGYLGGEIDLRFTFKNWKYAFAVVQPGKDGVVSRSLQFFDAQGNAAHKVYVKSDAGVAVFDKIVADFRNPSQSAELNVAAAPAKKALKPDSAVDVKEFQLAWNEINDVHQFNRLLSEFGVTREQGLRLGPVDKVTRIAPQAVRQLLESAAKQQVEIMAFLGNDSAIQIYSGKINKVQEAGGYFNVLDPEFNLHLRDSALVSGYIVKRAGVVNVEFYDKEGNEVVSFFGVRSRENPVPQAWIDLTSALPTLGAANQASR
ncbi:putative hemin transport protein [Duganella sp. CF402]|uniref:ChuX/HutX family heme-like substrate-binding protein n=1 Tax=unclassified Duganella TaxID=2636909 RepID=UPI0008B9EC3D|nr:MULTISPECIES: ChuX/HutX family heme-like substrate-binding protein [unclassified Duganella]RZT09118.1 putative hemin transport protein [Duganella sp. BK701]SEL69740.1 putative hemin transport protein [Duganella sp. CF402]